MNRMCKKGFILLTALIMLSSSFLSLYAEEANTPKEEVVYANLLNDGSIKGIYVVNAFDISGTGNITDYGSYTSVRNMNSKSPINIAGDTISIASASGRLFYEGALENVELPWNIGIKYYLDNTEYTAEALAGKSGDLDIKISITENINADSSFFENYALQASLVLDTAKAENIAAEGATTANIGGKKQLTYTILPGNEKNISISAKVTDFELEPIQLNGISLALDIDTGNIDEMTDKTDELQAGIVKLDDGANSLNNGVSELQRGISKLTDGANTLREGMLALQNETPALTENSSKINIGLQQISSALSDISTSSNSINDLTNGSTAAKKGIADLTAGINKLQESFNTYKDSLKENGIDISVLQQKNTETAKSLALQLEALTKQIEEIKLQDPYTDTSALEKQINDLSQLLMVVKLNSGAVSASSGFIAQLEAGVLDTYEGSILLQRQYELLDTAIQGLPVMLNDMTAGLMSLKTSISTLAENYTAFDNGIAQYTDAFNKLVTGYNSLYSGILGISEGTNELKKGTEELSSGTNKLRSETKDMDTQLAEGMNEFKNLIEKDSFTPVSFVCDKNTNVDSVQFVIKTEGIKIEKAEAEAEPAPVKLTFWQKLLALFGLFSK